MNQEAFDQWLTSYGAAWEAKNAEAFAALFSANARYHWTPFEAPKQGRAGVAAAFSEAVVHQRDIEFRHEILAVGPQRCVARWWCSLIRMETGQPVRLDGILTVEPAPDGLCEVFREWWHSDEAEF